MSFVSQQAQQPVLDLKRMRDECHAHYTAVWSCGAGVDSTAIAVAICQGMLPKPDLALMVDAGYEMSATWDHVRKTLIPRLAEVGVTLNIIPSAKYVKVQLFDGARCVLPLFQRTATGEVRKFSTRCSGTWKMRVSRRWLREQGVRRAENWVGIAADETRRARGKSGVKWIKIRYPLIELGWDRERCVYEIGRAGWPVPARTSCIMCPLHRDAEWARLKRDCPDDWNRAVAIECEIRAKDPTLYLRRACVELKETA